MGIFSEKKIHQRILLMMLRAPSEAVKSNKQKCSGSGTDVGEWRKAVAALIDI